MIHAAIVEDNRKTRENLQQFLKRYGKESGNEYTIHVFEDGNDIVNNYRPIYDIILMDIQMKHMDGMTAAEEIRKKDGKVVLVFITNMMEYAVRGYAVNAVDYILKPFNYLTFAEHMKRIDNYLKQGEKNNLVLNTAGGMIKINTSDIYYLESLGHYIHIHTTGETVTILDTMKNMEQALADDGFFRCNNSYLVNLAYVEKVDKFTAAVGGDEIQISRPKKKAFMEALADYLGGMRK